jgi:hypothetical protein
MQYIRGILMAVVGASLANASTCPTTTLDNYLTTVNSAGGCSVGQVEFQDFQYQTFASGGSVAVPPIQVLLTPISNLHGDGFDISFTGLTASSDSNDAELQYLAHTLGPSLTSVYAELDGSIIGNGQDQLVEDICPTSGVPTIPPDPACALATGTIYLSIPGTSATTESFVGNYGLATLKDVKALGCPPGELCGTATVTGVINQIGSSTTTQTLNGAPEPGFYGVLTLGLAAIFVLQKRRRTK